MRDGWRQASSRISPNVEVGPDCYANEILADASVVLTEALNEGTGRFDASDLMPAEVGSGSFWTGMVEYVRERPGLPRRRARRHRGELAVVLTGRHRMARGSGRETGRSRRHRRRGAGTSQRRCAAR